MNTLESTGATQWLALFENNRSSRVPISFPNGVVVPDALRNPLISSLQKFQIGETGEGRHLRKCAAKTKDAAYEQCIDLFIKEEQSHARALAEMIAAMDGTLLSWDWTDIAFLFLRRLFGLKTELLVLLIAEVIGKCFYQQCAEKLGDNNLSAAFTLLVLDEIAHLEFHSQFLRSRFEHSHSFSRDLIGAIWTALFFTSASVFMLDHKRTLVALGVTPSHFMSECAKTFRRVSTQSLAKA